MFSVANLVTGAAPSCFNRAKAMERKIREQKSELTECVITRNKIIDTFGKEYCDRVENKISYIKSKMKRDEQDAKILKLVDSALEEEINKLKLEFNGNCKHIKDDSIPDYCLYNKEGASCFKTSANRYLIVYHEDYFYDGHFRVKISALYSFSHSVDVDVYEGELCNHKVSESKSDHPETSMYSSHFDDYEIAEFFWIQDRLSEWFNKFLNDNNLIDYQE